MFRINFSMLPAKKNYFKAISVNANALLASITEVFIVLTNSSEINGLIVFSRIIMIDNLFTASAAFFILITFSNPLSAS